MLLVAGGNEAPTAKDVSTVLDAAGISTDEARLKMLLSELEGKKLEELIEMGKDMLHVGGGMAAAAPAAGGAAPAGAPAAKAAEKVIYSSILMLSLMLRLLFSSIKNARCLILPHTPSPPPPPQPPPPPWNQSKPKEEEVDALDGGMDMFGGGGGKTGDY